jgi:hypothetical protein
MFPEAFVAISMSTVPDVLFVLSSVSPLPSENLYEVIVLVISVNFKLLKAAPVNVVRNETESAYGPGIEPTQ